MAPQELLFNSLKEKGLFMAYSSYTEYLAATGQPKLKNKFEDSLPAGEKERFLKAFGESEGEE